MPPRGSEVYRARSLGPRAQNTRTGAYELTIARSTMSHSSQGTIPLTSLPASRIFVDSECHDLYLLAVLRSGLLTRTLISPSIAC